MMHHLRVENINYSQNGISCVYLIIIDKKRTLKRTSSLPEFYCFSDFLIKIMNTKQKNIHIPKKKICPFP